MAPSRQQSPGLADAQTNEAGDGHVDRVQSSSSLQDLATLSDPENGERPVREQLKKTTIAGTRLYKTSDDMMSDDTSQPGDDGNGRGPIARKRSHEDVEDESAADQGERHVRKKSKDLSGSPRESENGDATTGESAHTTNGLKQAHHSNNRAPASQSSNMDTDGPATPPSDSMTDDKVNALTSPKNKRPHADAFVSTEDATAASHKATEPILPETTVNPTPAADTASTTESEPRAKRQKDKPQQSGPENAGGEEASQGVSATEESSTSIKSPSQASAQPASTISSGGFSNTSSTSPFGALLGSKSPDSQKQTSASAFAASGFSALSGSSASPFGSLGAAAGGKSPFAALGDKKSPTPAPANSGFGGTLSNANDKSPFASLGAGTKSSFASPGAGSSSGFGGLGGKLSGGFGGNFGGGFSAVTGPKLSSFAGGSGPQITGLSEKPAKPFGASANDDDDEDEDEEGSGEDEEDREKSPKFNDQGKKDKRFFEQDVETGEEGETTVFSCRAKLYNFVKLEDGRKEWKERGLGTIKLNVKEGDDHRNVRFIMRADGSHRVILNTPVKKEINVGDPQGGRPKGQYVYFSGSIDNKPQLELLQLKVRQQFAEELYDKIVELKNEM